MMTATELLKHSDAMTAKAIAERLGLDIDDVYAELIHAESMGKVRVIVEYSHGKKHARNRLWDSMEVTA